ncbi:MAG: hypothetical protein NVSMB25_20340 [Thermoleophilaceae bacterium]
MFKPSLTAAAAACACLLLDCERALADAGEKTPVNLQDTQPVRSTAGGGSGGSLVRTFVGLAIVLAVIYGLYWVLKQVKAGREEKASGQGLAPVATLPLGTNRSLQLVRAGKDIVLLGVTEQGVTPIKIYHETEAETAGLLVDDPYAIDAPVTPSGGLGSLIEGLRRMTVRR